MMKLDVYIYITSIGLRPNQEYGVVYNCRFNPPLPEGTFYSDRFYSGGMFIM